MLFVNLPSDILRFKISPYFPTRPRRTQLIASLCKSLKKVFPPPPLHVHVPSERYPTIEDAIEAVLQQPDKVIEIWIGKGTFPLNITISTRDTPPKSMKGLDGRVICLWIKGVDGKVFHSGSLLNLHLFGVAKESINGKVKGNTIVQGKISWIQDDKERSAVPCQGKKQWPPTACTSHHHLTLQDLIFEGTVFAEKEEWENHYASAYQGSDPVAQQYTTGIHIAQGNNVVLQMYRCVVQRFKQNGIVVGEGNQACIRHCNVYQNGLHGIVVDGEAHVYQTITGSNNPQIGVGLKTSTHGSIVVYDCTSVLCSSGMKGNISSPDEDVRKGLTVLKRTSTQTAKKFKAAAAAVKV